MKPYLYFGLIGVLLLGETLALYLFVAKGAEIFRISATLHLIVAAAFGILTGIHRKSVPSSLLSIVVIVTNPVLGILTMILLDHKFNRVSQLQSLESSENFEVGNPFTSPEGGVEVTENGTITDPAYPPVLQRLLDTAGGRVSEREVEVLSSMRSVSVLPLLEKVASASSGEGRLLAQAAIQDTTERAVQWSANLHRLEVNEGEVPEAMEHLAVEAYLSVRKAGRTPRVFGLPSSDELRASLEQRIRNKPEAKSLTLLCELLIVEEELDAAAEVIKAHTTIDGFDYQVQMAKWFSARGDWISLIRCMETIKPHQWQNQSEEVARFWAAFSKEGVAA